MGEKKKTIVPIVFTKREHAIQPISFVEKPISFIAHQRDQKGMLHEIEVDNMQIAGAVIPYGMSVEEYERIYTKILESTEKHGVADVEVVKDTIIRPRIKNSELDDLTNYELMPLYKRIYQNRHGEVDYQRNEIVVQIIIKERHQTFKDTFSIRFVDIEKLTKIIAKKFPTAIIYDKKDAPQIENDFREKVSQAKMVYCYTDAGWQIINSKNVYLHSSHKLFGAEVLTPLNLPCDVKYGKKELVETWQMALNVYKNHGVASTLVVYSFLGISYKLFDDAGYAPHFLLFLNGKTGSLKTTIAKILFTQLAEDGGRDFPRRIDADTVTSFERALVLSGRDTTTLIDDYAPAKSASMKSELANKLEAIVRMVGDGSTKSRSNVALEDCRGEGVKGTVVLTGELRGKGLSSNLRCLYCEMEKESVNLEAVTWFQQNRDAYTSLIQHFAYYLSAEWVNIVSYIKEQFEKKRREAEQNLKARRLIDTLVTLWLMADILESFFVSYCNFSSTIAETQFRNIRKGIQEVVVRSELLSNEESPALLFMRTIVAMLESGRMHITTEKPKGKGLMIWDGFEDDLYIYLLPEDVYSKAKSWLRFGGVYFDIELNSLGALLCKEGYAVETSNGLNKKLNYARVDLGDGRKCKFLKIPKSVIQKLQQNEDDI